MIKINLGDGALPDVSTYWMNGRTYELHRYTFSCESEATEMEAILRALSEGNLNGISRDSLPDGRPRVSALWRTDIGVVEATVRKRLATVIPPEHEKFELIVREALSQLGAHSQPTAHETKIAELIKQMDVKSPRTPLEQQVKVVLARIAKFDSTPTP